jgi:hypothetical protein
MNNEFSGGFGGCAVIAPGEGCCYSNTNSAGVVLEQQWEQSGVRAEFSHTGGMLCFLL